MEVCFPLGISGEKSYLETLRYIPPKVKTKKQKQNPTTVLWNKGQSDPTLQQKVKKNNPDNSLSHGINY